MKKGIWKERGGLMWKCGIDTVKEGFGGLVGGEKSSC